MMSWRRLAFLLFVGLAVLAWAWLTIGRMSFRRPASEKDFPQVDFEILKTDDDLMVRQIKLRLLQGFVWVESADRWQIKLNSFVLVESSSSSLSACQAFKEIFITVIPSGLLVSGEPPRFSFRVPCQESDKELILPQLDFAKIQREVKSTTVWQEGDAQFQARGLDEDWSKDWELYAIELVPGQGFPPVEIDRVEIQAVRPGAAQLTLQ